MSKAPKYPLEQLALIKQKRLEEAEKALKEKKTILEQEEKKLKDVESQRDEVKKHKQDKLLQLREELDAGCSPEKVLQMKLYLKLVEEKLIVREKKVQDQKKNVETAEKNFSLAKDNVNKRRHDIEKIDVHRKEWKKEALKEQERVDAIENDELGSQVHLLKKSRDPIKQSLNKKKS